MKTVILLRPHMISYVMKNMPHIHFIAVNEPY